MAAFLTAARMTFRYAEIQYGVIVDNDDVILVRTDGSVRFSPGTIISESGWHVGILFNGRIHCNVHPNGLLHSTLDPFGPIPFINPRGAWFNNFSGTGEPIARIHTYMRGPSLLFDWRIMMGQ